ncbi:MAG: NAD(P)/FAD-dependent oxidoreductase [Euryarchaeota archaeon]|nr:NAD(P)/FAD-dependent oxidoreductase [Euryarchaeota archaeon]
MNCDVLVVGASPAGIMAATSAAQAGAEVTLLDKDFGSLDHPANTFFDGMVQKVGFEVDDRYVLHDLDGMHIISPAGHRLEIPTPGRFIDRARFDEIHLRRAELLGVHLLRGEAKETKLLNGERLVKIGRPDPERRGPRIDQFQGWDEIDQGEMRAGVVIDAGGVASILARGAGLYPMRHPEDVAWALEALVELPGLGEERFFEYWVGSLAPGWKATFSPGGGDRATLGVFVRGHGRDVRPFLDGFIQKFKRYKSDRYPDADDLKIVALNRGGDPIATLPGEVVSSSLMVVGAAAGQSGMVYSMRAGEICGTVAAQAMISGDVSKEALSWYRKRWTKEFYWEFRIGRACLETLRNMCDEDIDALTKGLAEKNLDLGGSSTRMTLSALFAVLSARPGVLPALMRSFLKG